MLNLMNGMSGMGFLIAAVFFLRFWRRTADGLFVTFAAAFLLLALNQILLGLPIAREDQSLLYLPRVVAFALLIVAIVLKNVAKKTSSEG
jgi:undecaprenyl pyrophosphate phosphatase UppP